MKIQNLIFVKMNNMFVYDWFYHLFSMELVAWNCPKAKALAHKAKTKASTNKASTKATIFWP